MANSKIPVQTNLRFLPVTYIDTISSGTNVSNGVLLSDLTDGIITDKNQIKGLAFFNPNATMYWQLIYLNKLMVARQDPALSDINIKFSAVIMY